MSSMNYPQFNPIGPTNTTKTAIIDTGTISTGNNSVCIGNDCYSLQYGSCLNFKTKLLSFFGRKHNYVKEAETKYPQDVEYLHSDLEGHYFKMTSYIKVKDPELVKKIHEMLISDDTDINEMAIELLLKEERI